MIMKKENIADNKYTRDRSKYIRECSGASSPSSWLILKDTQNILNNRSKDQMHGELLEWILSYKGATKSSLIKWII